ncbi:hypothetical protein H5410_009809 [Solanum commersonii]|uniref:Uncharacterized protein n=1 Tax=Solanum commersonii TaxID=4109 RepID=A0A9J6AKQ6_SOLCO|nr:hypothetical protein H5410_009809 [Solanum commersonii]
MKEIGKKCRGWLKTEEETELKNHLRWARIKGKVHKSADSSECINGLKSDARSWVNIIKLSKEFGAIFYGFEKEARALFEKLDQRREVPKSTTN